jgi:acetyltransferase-like isoleucine patch superfamily enzyme
MDLLIAYSPAPEIGRFPFFGTTVAETAASVAARLSPGQLLALPGPDGGGATAFEAAGARSVTVEEAVEVLRSADAERRGILMAPGVVSISGPGIATLLETASPGPVRLENDAGQVMAIAGALGLLATVLRGDFDEMVAAFDPTPIPPVSGQARIDGAAAWSAAVRDSQRRTARRFQENGALLEDPETLWADPTCDAGAGARIGASVRLTGNTRIAGGAEVQSFCRLENTEVESGARVLSHSVLLDSSIGRDAKVGPFAHIRPNTRLEPESFAGSFVETKNAVLARRAALPHLSYVGDADVGVRANLGAGTITCNYDGRGKHRTVVEAGAFVGSNAILVAPVTIGRRAFVAAGSVIVEDVPEGALAIARGRQAVKTGRAAGRFEGADEV